MRQAFLGLLALVCGTLASAQFPQPYCAETFTGGVSPITKVQLGTIDNSSPVTPSGPAHEDFTGQSTTLLSGSKYTITVAGPAPENTRAYFRVYFDWNRDNDFADNGEYIYIGNLTNSTGADGMVASTTFTVPFPAAEGPVRMRVVKKYTDIPWLCNTDGIGQAEDYTVVVNYPPPVSVYVNAAATGLNNGSSWTNAYTSLTQAIDSMRPRDTLKVAAGTYIPGQSETSSFRLKEGTVLLGGYPSTGNPTDAHRDHSRYPAILSGVYSNTPGATYKVYHVLQAEGVTEKTIVDGFIIEGGRAEGNSDNNETVGGGVYIQSAHPIFRNCVWRNNLAREGAAIACLNGSSPRFVNCFVVQNTNYGRNSTVRVTGNSHPQFINTVFWRNTGTTVYSTGSSASFTNCSFVNNYLGTFLFEPLTYSIYAEEQSTIAVRNSIFFNNGQALNTDSSDLFLNLSSAQVEATITQVYHSGADPKQYQNPRFRDTASVTGPDGLFFTADDGLQLVNPCSPALNAGSNTAVTAATDMLGRPRIFGAAVDLGAYEVQEAPLPVPSVIYVDSAATGRGDGSSWANAYTDLQQAFQACSDTIKVAAGTYYPSRDNPVISLWLESGRTLLGGYPSGGALSEVQRDPALHPTIISGRLPASGGKNSLVVLRGRFIDSTSVVDGVTVEAAAATYTGYAPYRLRGGVLLTHGSAPLFRHCVLRNDGGGALRISGQSRPTFRQTVFDNKATYNTELVAVTAEGGSAPRFIGCTFRGTNTPAAGDPSLGSAMANYNAHPYIDSCAFVNNGTTSQGGAIYNSGGSRAVIRNTAFSGNYASDYGNDLYNDGSVMEVFNCTFDSREKTRYGGAVANMVGARATFTQCQFRNGYADAYGGAVFNQASEVSFTRCVFVRNRASLGGALYNMERSTARLTNCVAVENQTRYASAIYNAKSVLALTHCTFINNRLLGYDNSSLILAADSSETTVRNSVFYDNDLFEKTAADIIRSGNNVVTVTNSITKFYGTHGENGNIVGKHPRLVNNLDPDGPDNIFFTEDDGAALSPCSPAIEAGDNTGATGIDQDVLEKERLYGSHVDMGAYEFRGTRQQTRDYYVKANAAGSGTGLSWQDAYTSLQKGLCEPCADTLRVAAGVYKPAASARDSSFIINQPLAVVGGYGEDGSRDPFTHLTILSGNIGNPADSLDNSNLVLGIPAIRDTVLLDGLVIRDGQGGGGGMGLNAQGGGGLLTYWNHTIVRNCQFISNRAFPYGGGLSMGRWGAGEITHSLFSGNSGVNSGGAVYMGGDSLMVNGCVFENNRANGQGGAIHVNNGLSRGVKLANNVFYRNFTTGLQDYARGGAVYAAATSQPLIVNCSFVENSTALGTIYSGAGLYAASNYITPVHNSIFKGNKAGSSATTMGADLNWTGNYYVVTNSYLQSQRQYTTAPNRYGDDPGFIDYTTPKGKDGRWLTADDGLRLNYNAPAVDFGGNEYVPNTPDDILGRQRITGTAVDAGAYEHDGRLIAYAGPHREICPGSTTRLGITGNPAHTYSWTAQPAGFTSAEATPVVTPSDNTTYYLEVSDGSTILRDTVVVTIDRRQRPTVSIAASAAAVCQGSTLSFTATPVNASSITEYRWLVNGVWADSRIQFTTTTLNNGDEVKLQIVVPTCAGIDTVSSNTVAAVITALPVANAGRDTTICSGTSVTLGAPAVAGHTYAWTGYGNGTTGMSSTSAAQPVLTPTGAGSYIVTVTSPAGCVGRDTVFVGVSPSPGTPTITANGATTICQGASVTLSASAAAAYQWYRDGTAIAGATGRQLTTITGGSYTVGIPGGACVPTSVPIIVTVKPLPPKPTISVSGYTLTSSASGGNQWYKDWAPVSGATAQTYTASVGGIYAVQVTQNGCSALSDTLSLVTTGIGGPSAWKGEVVAYPNPADKELFLRNTGNRRLHLQLLDASGRKVYEGRLSASSGTIDLRGVHSGVYQLLITDLQRKETISMTIVKQ